MGWTLEPDEHWQWRWCVYNSAYGAVLSVAPTLADASTAMLIAEADLVERPYPASVIEEMRADPERHTHVRATDPIERYLSPALPLRLEVAEG
jgi:hypothetical protein